MPNTVMNENKKTQHLPGHKKQFTKAALFSTIYEQDAHGRLWELASIKARLTTQKSENENYKKRKRTCISIMYK